MVISKIFQIDKQIPFDVMVNFPVGPGPDFGLCISIQSKKVYTNRKNLRSEISKSSQFLKYETV